MGLSEPSEACRRHWGSSRCSSLFVRLPGHRHRCIPRRFDAAAGACPRGGSHGLRLPQRGDVRRHRRRVDRRVLGLAPAYAIVAVVMSLTMLATLWAPEPTAPGHPPRTLTDAVIEPLRHLLQRPGAWGFLLLVLALQGRRCVRFEPVQRVHDQGSRIFARRIERRRQGQHDHLDHDRHRARRLDLHALGNCSDRLLVRHRQALTNLLYMWLALAGKKALAAGLATSVDTMVGGMGQAAFVAFLVALCSRISARRSMRCCPRSHAVPRVTMGCDRGHGRDGNRVGEFLRRDVPDCRCRV
jgi:hypothetical protein